MKILPFMVNSGVNKEDMDTDKRTELIVTRFTKHDDWEDRYRELIKIGKEMERLSESECEERFKIKGCQSQVWLRPDFRGGKVYFKAESDAVLVRGIIAVIVFVYSGLSPADITKQKSDFLKEIGISEHLSMNRTNGLASMLKQVKMYGIAFQSLLDKGVDHVDNF